MNGRRGAWLLAAALCVSWTAQAAEANPLQPPVIESPLPDYAAVRAAWRPSDVRVLASGGRVIQRIRVDFSARRGDWVPLADISAALQRAVVQSEDHRFFSHDGVDWLASASAAWSAAWGEGRRGASTLSMQLAAMLDEDLRRGPDGRGILQKFDQMRAAQRLENRWTKAQILEAYLNLASYRGELRGVDALSRVLFQKRPSGLTLRESALAAVLLRGPNAPLATLARRSCALLRELGRPDDCAGLRDFIALSLSRGHAPRFEAPGLAPHWARHLVAQDGVPAGGEIRSTLDAGLQALAVRSVRRHLRDLGGTGVTDAAVVALDNRTGAVLAYVGSSGGMSQAPDVDHAQALRQAGSTLKPFLYALAFDQQRLTAASLLDDRPLDLDGGGGLYIPDNYDHRFSGWVSARTALASSLNVPAVRTLMLVGPDALARRLSALGLPLRHDGDYYGYSLALGSADVTLLSLVNAYRALARGGDAAPLRLTPPAFDANADADANADVNANVNANAGVGVGVGPSNAGGRATRATGARVFSPAAAWIVGDILSDRQARARTFGLDSPLSTPAWTAVKTGTSRDMRDNWCVGWSADYTVGVWVGNSAGASMRNVSGVSGAGPIWHELMDWLARERRRDPALPASDRPAAGEPAPPAGVTRAAVRFAQGLEPPRTEYFLGDTAQADFAPPVAGGPAGRPRIAEPVNGTVLALDPDIPWDRQRMRLRAVDALSRPAGDARWFLDGRPLADGAAPDWPPRPGDHVFELRDAAGGVLDSARVRVRAGRFLRPAS